MALELNAEEPSEITSTEYDDVLASILCNVESGHERPLSDLSDEQVRALTKLAYHEVIELQRLEDKVRNAIRDRGDGEPKALKFNLNAYRKHAREQRRRFEEDKLRRAKMALRNGRIEDNAKPDEEVQRVLDAAPGHQETQVKLYSQSSFLKCIGLLEAHRRGRIFYDGFYNNIFTDWEGGANDRVIQVVAIDDSFVLSVLEWMQLNDAALAKSCSDTTVRQAIQHFSRQDIRNEPRDWLKSLNWDNTPRLSSWLSNVYGVEQDKAGYHAAVGRCWLVSMAARIMNPGCKVDTMAVLIGRQGNRKSTSLRILGGKWYKTINTSIDKYADFLATLSGTLVAEIAELDAISRAADSRVKSMLSTAVDVYRPPYGRTTQEFKRTAVLAGSTNEKGNWHKDDSGGRRYWPIECDGDIDTDWLEENRDQLFAEALVLYDGGRGCWWDVPEDAQRARIEDHHTTDPWQEKIERWLTEAPLWTGASCDVERDFGDVTSHDGGKYWGTVITTARVMSECLQLSVDRQNRVTSVKVAQCMRNLGFELVAQRVSGHSPKKVWIVTRSSVIEDAQFTLLPSA